MISTEQEERELQCEYIIIQNPHSCITDYNLLVLKQNIILYLYFGTSFMIHLKKPLERDVDR